MPAASVAPRAPLSQRRLAVDAAPPALTRRAQKPRPPREPRVSSAQAELPKVADADALRSFWDWLARMFGGNRRAPPTSGDPRRCESPVASEVFASINAERAARGLAPLRRSPELDQAARDWSREMSKSGFRHSELRRLFALRGLELGQIAENIYYGPRNKGFAEDSPQNHADSGSAHVGLMKSPGHRKNILGDGWELAGVGTYCDKDGTLWVTQLFGRHIDSPTVDTSVTPPQDPIARASTETGSTCGGACGDG